MFFSFLLKQKPQKGEEVLETKALQLLNPTAKLDELLEESSTDAEPAPVAPAASKDAPTAAATHVSLEDMNVRERLNSRATRRMLGNDTKVCALPSFATIK